MNSLSYQNEYNSLKKEIIKDIKFQIGNMQEIVWQEQVSADSYSSAKCPVLKSKHVKMLSLIRFDDECVMRVEDKFNSEWQINIEELNVEDLIIVVEELEHKGYFRI